jgi:type IV pilus assembly protein PilB
MDLLSEAIVNAGLISREELDKIKKDVKGRSFILEMLERMPVDEEKLVSIYTEQFNFKRADLSDIPPDALEGFSERLALKYLCIPFDRENRYLKVAMVDPLDINTIQDLSFITELSIMPYVATKTEIIEAVNTYYNISSDLVTLLDNIVPETPDEIEILPEESSVATDVFQTGTRVEISDDNTLLAPAIKIVNHLLKEAMKCKASDIHIEPSQRNVEVRFRIDGVLRTQMEIPKWLHSAVISRIKIMSKLDISNRRTPQDGAIKIKIQDKALDLRVSTLPTHLGEKAVIRLLNPEETSIELISTGLSEDEYNKLKKAFTQPQGMILVTGPTGSGKTTTLHGILKELYSEEINIITVEDPVEYELKGITQVQVNEKAGLTFANTLRSILRQDPDVVMVGEIRDYETAEIAFRASMTGHLVLSTLHTNDTASTITRLIDLGVEPFLVGSSLLCVVAQRLLRLNCDECIREYTPNRSVLNMFPSIRRDVKFMRGVGCDRCSNTGYRGRIAVFEIMEITPRLKEMIIGGATAQQLKEEAMKEGMLTLYEAALQKVYNGVTTLEEVLRVIPVEEVKRWKECSECGNRYDTEECPYCGVPSVEVCKSCKKELNIEWQFCPYCGKPREKKPPVIESRYRVLVVDDEPGILKMVEVALRPLGLEIYTATNGREALEKVMNTMPNLIITDINMPEMDGFELIKKLRSNMHTMFIPIIILSSRDTAEDKLKGFTYGTDDYITKPFDYTELQARVKRLLTRIYV